MPSEKISDYKALSDEKLLSLSALDRDEKAFVELCQRYEDELWRFICRSLSVTGVSRPKRAKISKKGSTLKEVLERQRRRNVSWKSDDSSSMGQSKAQNAGSLERAQADEERGEESGEDIDTVQPVSSRGLDAEDIDRILWFRVYNVKHYQDNYRANCRAYIYQTARRLVIGHKRTFRTREKLLGGEKAAIELFGSVEVETGSYSDSKEDNYKHSAATDKMSATTPLPANISAQTANPGLGKEIGIDMTEDGEVARVLIDTGPGPGASIEQRQSKKWIRFVECWEDHLSDEHQEIILLARLAGKLTYKEMAEVLEEKHEVPTTFEQVKRRLANGYKELKECMRDVLTTNVAR